MGCATAIVGAGVASTFVSAGALEGSTGRLAGADRISTAVAVSRAMFADVASTPQTDSRRRAGAIVLASGTAFPDALVGVPLAVSRLAPLLLTASATLEPAVTDEITRVLAHGGTVYVLGGTVAVPSAIDGRLRDLGFVPTRVAGADRYATALRVAETLATPATVFLATGDDFADALAAGPAAARASGAVLLTAGSTIPAPVRDYIENHAAAAYAVGGKAAAAYPAAAATAGVDRYETASLVAERFFTGAQFVGVASGEAFPDALTGGNSTAQWGGPLLLTRPTSLETTARDYLVANRSTLAGHAFVYGGLDALPDSIRQEIDAALATSPGSSVMPAPSTTGAPRTTVSTLPSPPATYPTCVATASNPTPAWGEHFIVHVVYNPDGGYEGQLMALRRAAGQGSGYTYSHMQADQKTVDFDVVAVLDPYPTDHTYYAQFNFGDLCSVTVTPHA